MNRILGITLLLIAGCVGPGKLTTESGKPEVIIPGKTPSSVVSSIRSWAPSKGQIVQGYDSSTIVNTSSSVDLPAGLGFTQSVGARTVYNVVKKGNDCKVYSLRFIAASRDYYGYYKPMNSSSVLTNEFNSQEAYDQMMVELNDLAQYIKNN